MVVEVDVEDNRGADNFLFLPNPNPPNPIEVDPVADDPGADPGVDGEPDGDPEAEVEP
jgi:hypothetical protein